jgi:thiamine-monophosphate kinase
VKQSANPTAVGELDLIANIRRRAAAVPGRQLIKGIGDDCAILRPRAGEDLVVTTDMTLEWVHFRREWHPARSAGHRTLARGLSDLAAMGARPVAAFLSLALPQSATVKKRGVSWVDEYLDGLLSLAAEYSVPLAGGDTAEAASITADIVLLGAVPKGKALLRSTARVGDQIYVSGALGGAAAELAMLTEGTAQRENSRGKSANAARSARESNHPQLYPEPRIALGQMLLRKGVASAALDISDGLSTDLTHLCEESGLAATIYSDALPLHPLAVEYAERSADDAPNAARSAMRLALHGGEDYELLFTAPHAARIPKRFGNLKITHIGELHTMPGCSPRISLVDGKSKSPLAPNGWQHFCT